MNKDVEKRVQTLFAGVSSSIGEDDPEFAELIADFSH